MKCPKCPSERSAVVDSRSDSNAIRRRRECQQCQFRFSTYERVEYNVPLVIKKDGRREPFKREKLSGGLVRACEKRPVGIEVIEKTIGDVEKRLQELCVKEIDSRLIGYILMEYLQHIDHIAYIRFASVYREFSDVNQFVDTLQSLQEKAPANESDLVEE